MQLPDAAPTHHEGLLLFKGALGLTLSAFTGLIIRWAGDYRREKFWSWRRLFVEAPTMVGFGLMAAGIGEYLELGQTSQAALAALMGSLGARGFLDLVMSILMRKNGNVL